MEIALNLPLKQERFKPNGKEKSKSELFKERMFKVVKDGDLAVVYDHMHQPVKTLDETVTKRIFRTSRNHYPAVYDYDTGILNIVKYVPLHGHSSYSLLDGISRPEDIAEKAEIAFALTDHGNMFGALKFYKAMKKAGKKPIIGFEAYTSSLDYTYKTKDGDTLQSIARNNHVAWEDLIRSNPEIKLKGVRLDKERMEETIGEIKTPERIEVEGGQTIRIQKANARNHLVLIALNETGLKNLFKLVSIGQQKYTRGRPQIDWEDMEEHSEGVVVLTACLAGELPRAILNNRMDIAENVVERLIEIFGRENVYLEIQRHDLPEERILNPQILRLGKKYNLKVVATVDSHYTDPDDKEAHEASLCIGTKTKLNDPNRWRFPGERYHILTSSEMEELFYDLPELLDNTLDLAERIHCEIPMGQVHMPKFPVPQGFRDQNEYFRYLVHKGFEYRFKGKRQFTDPEYRERLEYEIETIEKMDFPGYFLIVADYVGFAKRAYEQVDKETANRWKAFIEKRGYDPAPLAVGPGRGSACGSLVAYCLNITNIDPIPYGLLFERFLNPDRISLPDIDVDFPDTRREEVLDYVRDLYGDESVSGIITFGTLGAKMVVRDVARIMDFPPSFGDKIAKMIPDRLEVDGKSLEITLENVVKHDVAFRQMYESDSNVKKVVDMGMKLEGLPRNTSIHACGYVVAPGPVTDFIPQATALNKETGERETVTQFDMVECEEMGLLKMDFLGLRMMGVIDRVLRRVNEKRKSEGLEPLDINKLSELAKNDLEVYRFIQRGNTAGVFQLESPGMTNLMKQLFQDIDEMDPNNPKHAEECFERLVAGISLYRPGPMSEIPTYLKNMLNPDDIVYDLPELEEILKPTYNVIVYQEQVMFIVRKLAGFSRGQSDNIRKAMGKKIKEIIEEYRDYFLYGSDDLGIPGCQKMGVPLDLAKDIWERMERFAMYAFNKSHSVGYSDIATMSGYLSCHYPTEMLCEILNSYKASADRIKQFIGVCKERGVSVLPPDVNVSETDFTVQGDAIRFGFSGLKNMGKSGEFIIEERKKRGRFKNLFDFINRMVSHQRLDKRMLESLIYSGALDSFSGTRKEKLEKLDLLLGLVSSIKKLEKDRMNSLFEARAFRPALNALMAKGKGEELDTHTRLMKEKEYTGFYVTGHPIDQYLPFLSGLKVKNFHKIHKFFDKGDEILTEQGKKVKETDWEKEATLVGVVQDIEVFATKRGERMASFEIEDETGSIRAVAFPRTYQMHIDLLNEGAVLYYMGKVQYSSERGLQFIADTIGTVESLTALTEPEAIQLVLSDSPDTAQKELNEIEIILSDVQKNGFQNTIPVQFIYRNKLYRTRRGRELKGYHNGETIERLQHLLGKENVRVIY